MFGFVIGTICLIGLAKMWRRRHYGWGGHWGAPRWHHHGGYAAPGYGSGYGGRHGFGPVDYVLRRLDATPEQSRVVRGELEDLFEKARGARREWRLSRDDVASAMRSESIDAEVMGNAFARHDETLEDLRKAFVGALSNIHDVLDERQRRRLADLIETGPEFGGFRPYRG